MVRKRKLQCQSYTRRERTHCSRKKKKGWGDKGQGESKKFKKMPSTKEGQMNTPGTFGTTICTTVKECWHWNRIAKGHFLYHQLERCTHDFFPECLLYLSLPEIPNSEPLFLELPFHFWTMSWYPSGTARKKSITYRHKYAFAPQVKHTWKYSNSEKSSLEK